jgi:branched-subunit amino acid transport protein
VPDVDKKRLRIYITAVFLPDVFITHKSNHTSSNPQHITGLYSQFFAGGGKEKKRLFVSFVGGI